MDFIHNLNQIAVYDSKNQLIAEVTFPDLDTGIVNIDHTFVDESLRGQGVAGQLMEEAAKEIRSQNKKARLTCSYSVKWFQSHSEYQDILS